MPGSDRVPQHTNPWLQSSGPSQCAGVTTGIPQALPAGMHMAYTVRWPLLVDTIVQHAAPLAVLHGVLPHAAAAFDRYGSAVAPPAPPVARAPPSPMAPPVPAPPFAAPPFP